MRHKCILSALVASLLGVTVPLAAQAAQAVTIDSNLVIKPRPAPPITKVKSRASVILLAGGNGVLNLNGQGDTRDLQGNFLVRSVRLFLNHNINVAMLDAEPAFPAPGGLTNQRLTAAHAAHLGKLLPPCASTGPARPSGWWAPATERCPPLMPPPACRAPLASIPAPSRG